MLLVVAVSCVVAKTPKIPIPRQCNTIAQFCVFCYDTEDLQTIHDLLPSLDGYTFYISPIEISCFGFRDGSFLTTPLEISNFAGTPAYFYEMKLIVSKGGLSIKSLIPDKNVQFISGDSTDPVFTVIADMVTIDGIDMSTTDESSQFQSPLVASIATDLSVRHSTAPVLLQQIVDKTTVVEVTDSVGAVAISNGPEDIICYITVSGNLSIISAMSNSDRLIISNTTPFTLSIFPGLQLELENKTRVSEERVTNVCTGTLSSPIIIVVIIVSSGIVIFFLDRFFSVSSTKEKIV